MVEYEQTQENKKHDILVKKADQLECRRKRVFNADFGMIASLGGVLIAPIVLGVLGGGWLDEHFKQSFSWRLCGIFAGFVWGIFNAYWWIKIEDAKIAAGERRGNKADGGKRDA